MSSPIAILAVFVATVAVAVLPAEAARAFFVFGDSLVDNGNNNYLVTTARADSPPYGIDYPTRRPTGRFSNGYNIPDLISQALGAESTLAYLNPQLRGEKLLVGANFASAGIGILNDTGVQFASIIRIFQQLALFQQYQSRRLYDLGARRVLVTGTGPLGCVPAELATRSTNGECAAEPQRAAAIFNPLLVQMIGALNQEIGSNIFVAVNAMEMQNDFITNPQAFGFITSKVACCGQGPYNGVGLCTVLSNLCPNRDVYAFWDPFHPTERANRFIVRTILTGSDKYMYPMNLSTIMALDSKT
ncbi:UNVERIFIED_CONTAM: GDSL esterase/lipase [Sesamum calycinum]|uniref:GDSL esterase/lipase n=1 Tax=Sesamum calycinum TaxID=2727403 RepID=A0AAW2SFJ8_9LAMI